MIIPVWKAHRSFWELGEIALGWWDPPADTNVYHDEMGFVLPPTKGWTARVVLFDGYANKMPDSVDEPTSDGYEADSEDHVRLIDLMAVGAQSNYARPRSHRTVRGVVEANQGYKECAKRRTKLEAEFKEKNSEHRPIHQVDPTKRPYGEHQIPFKTEDPTPQNCPP